MAANNADPSIFNRYKDNSFMLQPTHEDTVKMTAEKILSQSIPWDGYRRAELIKDNELELIKKYDKKPADARKALIQKDGEVYAELFLQLLVKINKEETLQYLLTVIDQLLTEIPQSVQLFLKLSPKNQTFPFEPLMRLLNRPNMDWYTYCKASIVAGTLMSFSNDLSNDFVKGMCNWVREQLRKPDEKDICNGISALQRLARKDEFRSSFAGEDGLNLLLTTVQTKSKNVQIVYNIVYCIWLLSYNRSVAFLISETKIIKELVEIMRRTGTHPKVLRMALSTLRNLLNIGNNNEQMIDAGIVKPLELLKNRAWGDEDMIADLEGLNEALQKIITHMSTFDVFKKELISGSLDWTPAHRSEKFWKENVHHFEDEQFKALLLLKEILENSTDAQSLSVACFDVGEFARFHPRGRILVQQYSLKLPLMKHMEDKSPEVRKHALLAVQKLMVTHWEFLTA